MGKKIQIPGGYSAIRKQLRENVHFAQKIPLAQQQIQLMQDENQYAAQTQRMLQIQKRMSPQLMVTQKNTNYEKLLQFSLVPLFIANFKVFISEIISLQGKINPATQKPYLIQIDSRYEDLQEQLLTPQRIFQIFMNTQSLFMRLDLMQNIYKVNGQEERVFELLSQSYSTIIRMLEYFNFAVEYQDVVPIVFNRQTHSLLERDEVKTIQQKNIQKILKSQPVYYVDEAKQLQSQVYDILRIKTALNKPQQLKPFFVRTDRPVDRKLQKMVLFAQQAQNTFNMMQIRHTQQLKYESNRQYYVSKSKIRLGQAALEQSAQKQGQ